MEKPDWYDAAVEKCASVNDIAGNVAGTVYGGGAMAISGNSGFAAAVDTIIDHQVTGGWADMCNLPANVGLFDSGGSASGSGHATDTGHDSGGSGGGSHDSGASDSGHDTSGGHDMGGI